METRERYLSDVRIPAYVSSWADEYFHKSAFDVPARHPSQRIINFLSRFTKQTRVKLYRGINTYNEDNPSVTSWTYNEKIARRYICEGGRIIKKEFSPEEILFDTTALSDEQRTSIGYDYKIDDKEVLILSKE